MSDIFSAIEIEINHNCNRSCSYCPNSLFEREEKGEISLDLYKRLMKQLKEFGFKGRVSYDFYNEPLLCSNLDTIVKMTREHLKDVNIELYTNGTLLTKERICSLIEYGVSNFIVTKHEGIDRYLFDDVYKNLDFETQEKIFYRKYQDVILTNRGGLLENVGEAVESALLPCYVPSSVVSVTVLGNVLPCFEDYHQVNVMGNISENHIMDIWNCDRYREFRDMLKKCQRHKYQTCNKCNRLNVRPMTRP